MLIRSVSHGELQWEVGGIRTEDLSRIVRGFVVVLDHCYSLMALCVRVGDKDNECIRSGKIALFS